MRTECPHCFTDVLPTAASQCPACRKPITGSPNTEFTKVTVSASDPSAGLCLKCGSPTQGRQRIHKTCKNVNYTPGGDRLAGHPIALFLNFLAGKHRNPSPSPSPSATGASNPAPSNPTTSTSKPKP